MSAAPATVIADYRQSRATRAVNVDLLQYAFPAQRAFASDPAPLKFAFCTRRAAKTYGTALEFMQSGMRDGGKHLIVGLTRESVRGSFWGDVLKAIDAKHGLGWTFNETRLEATYEASGGSIRLLGMDSNDNERRKALGQKYRRVAIDEAQDFRTDLESLVFSVLKPAVADYRGSIELTGTPSNLIRGFYFDLTSPTLPTDPAERARVQALRRGWSRHQWSTTDNPHMAEQWAAEIADMKAANPRVVETPWFRQNYLGEWVVELDKLVYRYAIERNDFAPEPGPTHGPHGLPLYKHGGWHYVLGCDLGYNDPTAWVVMAFHDHDPTLYVLEAQKEAGLDVTAVAERTREYRKRFVFDAMVIDNANKQAVEEMRKRHSLPWRAADKTGKSDFIEIMNGEFIKATIRLGPRCNALRDEYAGLIWDDRANKREEHPASPNHCCFVAGAMVQTEHGPRAIESVAVGDLVWTRKGLRPVTAAFSVGERETWEAETSAGTLRGTADHPVWTQHGWVELQSLTHSCTLTGWDNTTIQRSSGGTASCGTDTPTPSSAAIASTSAMEGATSTARSGLPCGVQSHQGTTSTTETKTQATTRSATCAASLGRTIFERMQASLSGWLLRAERFLSQLLLPPRGTGPTLVVSGTASMAANPGREGRNSVTSASFAAWHSARAPWQRCAAASASPSSAATQVQTTYRSTALSAGGPSTETATPNPGAVPVRVRRVAPTGCVERVYNLTVADAHEYFANGVLVSNCDAALYAWRYCWQFLSEKPAPAPTASEQEDQWEAEDEERERAKEEEASLWQ